MKRMTDFTEKAKLVHGDKYEYDRVNYTCCKEKIEIICPEHGPFWQEAYSHLRGCGCKLCASIGAPTLLRDDFLIKAELKFPEEFIYTYVDFNKGSDIISVICPKHGEFKTSPTRFLQTVYGCPQCAKEKGSEKISLSQDEFISRSKIIHKDKYDYSLVEYKTQTSPIKIICPYHGEFTTTPAVHLKGCNCRSCVTSGWDRTSWMEICNKNKNSCPCVYIIRCFNDEESFYKIGRTMRSIKDRFLRPTVMPYKYELIEQIIKSPIEIFNMENEMHKYNLEFRYVPKITFPGSTECFSNYKKPKEYNE